MSSNLAYAEPSLRPVAPGFVSPVRLVSTRSRRLTRPRAMYGLVAVAVVFTIFIAQLLLTIALSSGAYRITSLQGEQRDLSRSSSALTEKLNTVGSTAEITSVMSRACRSSINRSV